MLGSIVIARTLGASGKGLFTYANAALMLVLVTNGQSAAVAWQYTRRNRSPGAVRRTMLTIWAAACAPIVPLLAAIAWFVPGQSVLFWVAAAVPFALLVQSSTGFFLADGDVRTVIVAQLFPAVGAVLLYVALLVLAHAPLETLLATWVVGYVAGACYSLVHLRRYTSGSIGEDRRALFLEQSRYAFQSSLTSVVAFLNFKIDVFIIMLMLGNAQLGIYSIGIAAGEALWEISRAINTACFGRIARGTEAQAAQVTATCMRHCFALSLAGAGCIAVAAPLLIPLVYGRGFAGAVAVTWWLLPGIVAYSTIGALTSFFLQQTGEPRLAIAFRAVSLVICAAATVALLPRLGIAGGAIATSLSYVLSLALAAAYFARRTGIAASRLFLITKNDAIPYIRLMRNLRLLPLGTSQ